MDNQMLFCKTWSQFHSTHIPIDISTAFQYYKCMKRKHAKTLALLFHRPPSANVKFADVVALLVSLGAHTEETREGSRFAIVFAGEVRVLHKPHPGPDMDKGAVAAVRDWLESKGVRP